MLLQTNSYVVPKEKRAEHARLVRRFRQTLNRLGCDQFDVFEQVGANWSGGETSGRFVQMMRFRDRKHQLSVQAAEKQDPSAQALIAEFCELINFPYQQQQGFFAVGYYQSVLPVAPVYGAPAATGEAGEFVAEPTEQGDDGGEAYAESSEYTAHDQQAETEPVGLRMVQEEEDEQPFAEAQGAGAGQDDEVEAVDEIGANAEASSLDVEEVALEELANLGELSDPSSNGENAPATPPSLPPRA